MRLPAFVCLSVCLSVSKIIQKRVRGFGWNVACRHYVGTWTNWLTFQPGPDAGTGLISPLSYKRWYSEFYVWKIRRIRIGRCSDAWFQNGFTAHRCNNGVETPLSEIIRSTECPSTVCLKKTGPLHLIWQFHQFTKFTNYFWHRQTLFNLHWQ